MVHLLKKKILESKFLLPNEESWTEEDESSKDEVDGKNVCFMPSIDASFIEESSKGSSTFDFDLAQSTKDYTTQNQDSSSLYQVHKYVNYFDNEKL